MSQVGEEKNGSQFSSGPNGLLQTSSPLPGGQARPWQKNMWPVVEGPVMSGRVGRKTGYSNKKGTENDETQSLFSEAKKMKKKSS